jgi:SAM-dependent methyltransferase
MSHPTAPAAPSRYHDGLNVKLLEAVPPQARRVLELGCANGRLGQRFKALHPDCVWHGIERSPEAAAAAAAHLDQVFVLDLDTDPLDDIGTGYDTVVIGDLLEHLTQPTRLLSRLQDLCTDDATLACCLPNMGHTSVVERLLTGDMSYDEMGLLDQTHVRFYTLASATKLFLDCGWIPHLRDEYRVEPPANPLSEALLAAAGALGVPADTARRQLGSYQMILGARRWSMGILRRPAAGVPFSVVVPVTRPWQYELNIARSPGLKEVGAEVIVVQGAASAAEAYRRGAAEAKHPWILMAHQDVYFPQGSGLAITRHLAALEQAGRGLVPVGFAGIAQTEDGQGLREAGLVVDRGQRFDHGGSARAISLDELAIALHRDSPVQPDPALPWHLWATDLCLQAEALTGEPVGELLEVPLFHNSLNDYRLPESFHQAAATLLAKHGPGRRLHTLCGVIDADFVARAAAPRALPAAAPARAALASRPEPAPARREATLALHLPEAEAAIERLMDRGDAEGATARIVQEVHALCSRAAMPAGGMHLPGLDRQMQRLADALAHDADLNALQACDGGTLLLATELYDLTGHTRMLHDLAQGEERPMLILTDLFGRYARQPELLQALTQRFAGVDVIALPPGSPWEKCGMVKRAAEAVRPGRIVYFAHHQDPIPFIGTAGLPGPRKRFVHHGNQHPALGCTLAGVTHLDVDEASLQRCAASLAVPPQRFQPGPGTVFARVA